MLGSRWARWLKSPRDMQLDRIEALLRAVVFKEDHNMATLKDLQDAVDVLTTHANDLSNAVKNGMTTLDAIATQLKVAIASNDPVVLQALLDKVNAVSAQAAADNTALLDRVAADTTPAAPDAPVAPVDAAPATDAPAAPQV